MIAFIFSLACGVCCWLAWKEAAFVPKPYQKFRLVYPFVWVILAGILGLLAFQEWTGLLKLITDSARQDAIHEGWYGERRPFQWLLVKTVPVIAAGGGALILWLLRRSWSRYILAVAAIFYWITFAVIQGISYHNIDWLLSQHFAGLLLKTWGNMAGLLLTGGAILAARRDDRRSGTHAFSPDAGRPPQTPEKRTFYVGLPPPTQRLIRVAAGLAQWISRTSRSPAQGIARERWIFHQWRLRRRDAQAKRRRSSQGSKGPKAQGR